MDKKPKKALRQVVLMRLLPSMLIAVFGLGGIQTSISADLAANLCQDEYNMSDEKFCQGLIIGTIDSLFGIGEYCPDGATSYGYIIATWRRLLRNHPELKNQPTVLTIRKAMSDLGLLCRK